MGDDAEQRYVPECYACPIGAVSMRIQSSAPEATDHMIKAGKELLGAVRVLLEGLDAFLEGVEERKAAAERASHNQSLRSIPIRRES